MQTVKRCSHQLIQAGSDTSLFITEGSGRLEQLLLLMCLAQGLGLANSRCSVMFTGISWYSWLLVEYLFHCIRLLFIMLHTGLWIMSAVGRGLDWLMQVQCCLSLDAASTYLMHSCCFGVTVEIIYQSESAWGLSSLLNSITPFFMSSSTRSASGPTCFLENFNSFWQGASVPPSKSPPDICSHCLRWLAG